MADVGGHGVDEYLESNFQLPEEVRAIFLSTRPVERALALPTPASTLQVMALAIAQGVASGDDLGDGKGKTMTVDRTKTTMPQAVTALVEEALVRLECRCNLYFSCQRVNHCPGSV